MNKCIKLIVIAVLALSAAWSNISAQNTKVFTIKANEVKAKVAPTMWGLFFEDRWKNQ